jgi:hypothetical protein
MKEYKEDTSLVYEDLVGYVSEENISQDLSSFLGDSAEEYKPKVLPAKRDAEFPESWQTITLNFDSKEDYVEFMLAAGEKPMPKLGKFTYKAGRTDSGLLGFLED